IAAIAAGALYQAGVASAGCMATVGLAPPPQGIAPGTTWSAEITVLQHGVQPLPNAKTAQPTLTIVNTENGAQRAFVAQRTDDPAVYVAEVVFPAAGSWRYEVFDDFTSWGGEPAPCAQTHTFAAVDVGGPAAGGSQTPPSPGESAPAPAQPVPSAATGDDGSFPVWPVVGAVLAGLAAIATSLLLVRRHRGHSEVAAR
ncbi:MAG TPA: hypothetical protein VGK41_04330, partial [Solirubrobacterales bacterium]